MFSKPAQPREPRAPRPRPLHPKRRPPAQSAASSALIDSAHIDYVGANAFVGPASETSISSAPHPATTRHLNPSIIGPLLPSFRTDLSVIDLQQLSGWLFHPPRDAKKNRPDVGRLRLKSVNVFNPVVFSSPPASRSPKPNCSPRCPRMQL